MIQHVRSIGRTAAVAIALLPGAGCANKIFLTGSDYQVSGKQTLLVAAGWIKQKSDSFDVRLLLANQTDHDIIIMLKDLDCARGGYTGTLVHAAFGGGDRKIDVGPRGQKALTMVCLLDDGPETGEYQIVIRRVFDNPNADGATLGEVLAKNIEWKLPGL